ARTAYCLLPAPSLLFRVIVGGRVERPHALQRPVAEHGFAVDIFFRHQPPRAAVVRHVAVVAHDEVIMLLDVLPVFAHAGPAVARRLVALWREVRLVERHAVDRHATERVYINALARQPDDAL